MPYMSGKARIIAVANQKGGVGKSTTTINVARAATLLRAIVEFEAQEAAQLGVRVLIVDMDPQGNVTSSLVAETIPDDEVTLADALTPNAGVTLRDVIRPTVWAGVDIAPARATLSVADRNLTAMEFGREFRLRELLTEVADDYDLVLIDNPPTLLGQLMTNSLVAAHAVVLVTSASTWSGNGLALLGKTISGIRNYHNQQLAIAGVVVNKWRDTDHGRTTEREIVEGMARHFPGVPVWLDWRIPEWVGVQESAENGMALDEHKLTKLRVLAQDKYRPMAAELLGVSA